MSVELGEPKVRKRQRSIYKKLVAFDRQLTQGIQGLVAGVDEVGRGPLAGPVVAAAVILFPSAKLSELNDSKKLPPQTREILFRKIARRALVGVGFVDEKQIDRINIYQAARAAMKKAVLALSRTPDFLLIDGKIKIDLPLAQRAIVKGDAQSASIAAASVIAKVCRDHFMHHLDQLYPGYRFREHKGYATPHHLELLEKLGPSPVHRKSFSPIGNFTLGKLFS